MKTHEELEQWYDGVMARLRRMRDKATTQVEQSHIVGMEMGVIMTMAEVARAEGFKATEDGAWFSGEARRTDTSPVLATDSNGRRITVEDVKRVRTIAARAARALSALSDIDAFEESTPSREWARPGIS